MNETPDMHEQIFVSSLLNETSGKASSLLDTFSGWLLGGFGAAAIIMVSQYDSISKHINPKSIHDFLLLFVWALVLGVIQKYIAVAVISASQGAAVGREMGDVASSKSIPLNPETIISLIETAIIHPGRWFARRSFDKVKKGDFVSGARNYSRLMQVQGILGLVQTAITLYAICKIAFAFRA